MKTLKEILDNMHRDLEWRGPQGRALGHIALERGDAQDLLNHICSLMEALRAHIATDDGPAWTALQNDTYSAMIQADIPESYCTAVVEIIAAGERARQNLEDAQAIDALTQSGQHLTDPYEQTAHDELLEIRQRWSKTNEL